MKKRLCRERGLNGKRTIQYKRTKLGGNYIGRGLYKEKKLRGREL